MGRTGARAGSRASPYADEVRRREASLDPPASVDREAFLQELQKLRNMEERDIERLLEIARGKDERRMTKEDALTALRLSRILSCRAKKPRSP